MKSFIPCLLAIALGVTSLTALAQYNNRYNHHPEYRDERPRYEHRYGDRDYGYRDHHEHRWHHHGYPGPSVWRYRHNPGWWCDWRGCWYQPHYPRY